MVLIKSHFSEGRKVHRRLEVTDDYFMSFSAFGAAWQGNIDLVPGA